MRVLAKMVLVFVAAVVVMLAVTWVVLWLAGPQTPCVKSVQYRLDGRRTYCVCVEWAR